MVTLDSCPPELCQRIFQFACTDDGTTGRALSLVSKYIHLSSKRFKLQSVTVRGADQATHFVLALQRTPDQYRRVSYLTIVNDLTIHLFQAKSPFVRTTAKRLELGAHSYDMPCLQTNRRQDETVFIASLQILHLTSATLQTLNIDFQSMWQLIPKHLDTEPSAWRVHSMPVLRELTVRYGELDEGVEMDWTLFLGFGGEGRGKMAMLPRLRYLDLAGLRIPLHSSHLYKQISKVAPSLMHLRLPMRMAGRLGKALGLETGVAPDGDGGVALGIPTHFQSPTITTPAQKPSLLPIATLQRVYIQPQPAPKQRYGNDDFPFEKEAYMLKMDELKEVESRDERVVVLDCTMADLRMEDIAGGWDRERGGDGL